MSNDVSFYALTASYPDEDAAEQYFVAQRWPVGVTCPKCGTADVARGTQTARRRQCWYCHNPQCEAMFSVTSGTVMADTKLPLRKWLLAFHLLGASKKSMSSLQLSRMLDVSHKTAWHLSHRIRATMTDNSQHFTGIVETDETYIGGKRHGRGRGYRKNKMAVQTIIKRGRNPKCRPDDCLPGDKSVAQTIALNHSEVDGRTVGAKLRTHTDPEKTVLMTDDSPIYNRVGENFAEHHTVNHSEKEYAYVANDGHLATTNTAEGYFANLKRQLNGTHHHTSKKHLGRYLEEHDHNYNHRDLTDTERAEMAIGHIEGRRVKLYKGADGRGDSLFDHKANEPPVYFTGIVETDETYIGGKRRGRGRGYRKNKMAVQTIIKRGRNPKCRSEDCLPGDKSVAQTIALNKSEVDGRTVGAKLRTHTDPAQTVLMTDDSPIYNRVGESFAEHHTVNHSEKEYAYLANDGHLATTNTAEGYFSNLKRQLNGTHHHTSKKHLGRYLEEHDHNYNHRDLTDTERTESAIKNVTGRRVKLYKGADGRGDSLFDHRADEPPVYYKGELPDHAAVLAEVSREVNDDVAAGDMAPERRDHAVARRVAARLGEPAAPVQRRVRRRAATRACAACGSTPCACEAPAAELEVSFVKAGERSEHGNG